MFVVAEFPKSKLICQCKKYEITAQIRAVVLIKCMRHNQKLTQAGVAELADAHG